MAGKQATIDFVSGCVGGVSCVLAGQPLDTVKIKMQTFSQIYKNSFRCFVDILRTEGMRGLYAGTSPALLSNIMENSVLFLAYGQCQNIVAYFRGTEPKKLSPFYNACAGSLTSNVTAIVLCPPELIKCRLQTAREVSLLHGVTNKITMFSVTKEIFRQDGITGFFQGLTALYIREVPANFFFFGGYESAKYLLISEEEGENVPAWKYMLAGGLGGMAFWGSIYPVDVIKSKMQIWNDVGQKPTFLQIGRTMLKNEGIVAFYRGIGPTLVRAFPANAALFYTYEWVKAVLWGITE